MVAHGGQPMSRLTKSRTDRMFSGVCAGLAEYFEVDPTWVRIAFVVATLMGGPGIIAYLIGMLVMPAPRSLAASSYRALPR